MDGINGAPNNPGTYALPLDTIQAAVDLATQSGDSVNVIGGQTYYEDVMISGKQNFTLAGDGNCIVDGNGILPSSIETNAKLGLIEVRDSMNIVIRGLRVVNSAHVGITVRNQNFGINTKDVTVEDCEVYNSFNWGIIALAENHDPHPPNPVKVTDITIRRNKVQRACTGVNVVSGAGGESITTKNCNTFWIYHNEVWDNQKEGIDATSGSTNGLIYRNLIRHRDPSSSYPNNTGPGIYIEGGASGVSNIEVFENVVHDQAIGISVASESGGTVDSVTFTNNIVYNPWTRAFQIAGGAGNTTSPGPQSNVKVNHNTFVGQASVGPPWPAAADQWVVFVESAFNPASNLTGFEFINNIVTRKATAGTRRLFQNTYGLSIPSSTVSHNLYYNQGVVESGPFHGSAPVIGDPKFTTELVLIGWNNVQVPYSIQSTSKAKDMGMSFVAPVDIDGVLRPVGAGPDAGAFEYD